METTNDANSGKLFTTEAEELSKNKETIFGLGELIIKSFGNSVVDRINAIEKDKVAGKRLTTHEYAKIINEDEHLKLLFTCINQRTLKRIYGWILFWGILTVISIISYMILFISIYRELSNSMY